MTEDVFSPVDGWGPEKVVRVADRRTGMRGVLVLTTPPAAWARAAPAWARR